MPDGVGVAEVLVSGDGGLCREGAAVIFLQGVRYLRVNFEKTGRKVQKLYPQAVLKTAKREVIHRTGNSRMQGRCSAGKVKEPTH